MRGLADEDSHRARKASVRFSKSWQEKEFKKVIKVTFAPKIQFGPEDEEHI